MSKVLKNKEYKSYDYFCRYTSFPYYYHTIDNKYIYGMTSQVNKNIPFVLHKVKRNETIDSIALDFYNNPSYFWALCDFNDIRDPYETLEEGRTLKIPTLSEVRFEV